LREGKTALPATKKCGQRRFWGRIEMDIVFIISSIPIFILLLFPLIWIRDVRFAVVWTLIDLLITWQLASQISSFATEQWNILTTSFAIYPFFEAFKVAIISTLSLAGVAALIFILYFLSICFICVLADLELPIHRARHQQPIQRVRNEVPRIPFYYTMREHEGARLTPISREALRRLMEED
jgi:hypothetical protein